jgi:2,4-dienoyl-CoA reductase-like NADH-dependent reductase (Old Yellow Enzyme family)
LDKVLGTPKACTLEDIEEVIDLFKHATRVAAKAGFDGIQLHGAHGFLLSQFLSPHTNRRTDDYGGNPENRMRILRRLVDEIREEHPAPFCLSVKLNSADYMDAGVGLQQDEGLQQVQWLLSSGKVDFGMYFD